MTSIEIKEAIFAKMKSTRRPYRQAYVEITSACNFKCHFCPSPTLQRSRSFMDPEVFDILAPQVAELADQVYLHVMGEPTLHPKLESILGSCKSQNLPVAITTNGSLLEKCGQLLLDSPHLRQINLSLHALKASPLPRPAEMILSEILEFCKQALLHRPDLYINLRLWNLADINSGVEESWNLEVRQQMQKALNLDPFAWEENSEQQLKIRGRKSWNCKGRLYLHFDSRFEWPSHSQQKEKSEKGTCKALNTHFAVLVDGRVVPCCLDESGSLELGRVPDQTLVECLKSPRALAMDKGFRQGKLVESFCQSCQFCKRFKVKS